MSIERPKKVQDAIIEGNTDTLRALGRKGAQVRAEKFEKKKIIEEYDNSEEFQKLYDSEFEFLNKTYPVLDEDGNPVVEGDHEEQAKKYALAIIAIRKRQKDIESRR